ncbi:unnamed protein product [Trichogramma brassicae]|uniref:Uncharacterized protein n=1 Tax=Trichogramma brassicae TaxID=86971 RepID=A0A6H5IXR2_9HYME|nr:unnamed protein product [Trichogramma brassicae]
MPSTSRRRRHDQQDETTMTTFEINAKRARILEWNQEVLTAARQVSIDEVKQPRLAALAKLPSMVDQQREATWMPWRVYESPPSTITISDDYSCGNPLDEGGKRLLENNKIPRSLNVQVSQSCGTSELVNKKQYYAIGIREDKSVSQTVILENIKKEVSLYTNTTYRSIPAYRYNIYTVSLHTDTTFTRYPCIPIQHLQGIPAYRYKIYKEIGKTRRDRAWKETAARQPRDALEERSSRASEKTQVTCKRSHACSCGDEPIQRYLNSARPRNTTEVPNALASTPLFHWWYIQSRDCEQLTFSPSLLAIARESGASPSRVSGSFFIIESGRPGRSSWDCAELDTRHAPTRRTLTRLSPGPCARAIILKYKSQTAGLV